MSRPGLSVILSTFNRPDALRLALDGYLRSTFRDFEVIVADDGSTGETAALVRAFAADASFPIVHSWQPDEGFRLAAARNLAVRSARGDVLVFTDGDCIPLPDALEWHARRCAPGFAHTGDRCILERGETEDLVAGRVSVEVLARVARERETRRLRRLRHRNRFYAWTRIKPRPKLLTANAAVHRRDFEAVNGFDERFVGWGYEDEDLARRLRRAGVRVLDGCLESLVLHLFHAVHESHRPDARSSANYAYFQRGSFLTRPLRGFLPRRVEDVDVELVGEVPEALRGLAKPEGKPEVSVDFVRKGGRPGRVRGDVVIRVDPRVVTSLEQVHALLLRSL